MLLRQLLKNLPSQSTRCNSDIARVGWKVVDDDHDAQGENSRRAALFLIRDS